MTRWTRVRADDNVEFWLWHAFSFGVEELMAYGEWRMVLRGNLTIHNTLSAICLWH